MMNSMQLSAGAQRGDQVPFHLFNQNLNHYIDLKKDWKDEIFEEILEQVLGGKIRGIYLPGCYAPPKVLL